MSLVSRFLPVRLPQTERPHLKKAAVRPPASDRQKGAMNGHSLTVTVGCFESMGRHDNCHRYEGLSKLGRVHRDACG